MPSCTSTESLSRVWPSNESIHAGSSSGSNSGPTSPTVRSPISTSPDNTLKRSRFRARHRTNSMREPFVIRSECRRATLLRSSSESLHLTPDESGYQTPEPGIDSPSPLLVRLIGWYPCLLLRITKAILIAVLPKTWRQLALALPMLWFSMWIWLFSQLLNLPLAAIKLALSLIAAPRSATCSLPRRTVLISGGSTIQALHLARNFHGAGARVVVCEVEGLFALARFSTAVSKFYTVPRPTSDQQQNYVRALCDIVDREQISYYIPVSSTTSAYYDAVAKPHLELLGCSCFCPGIREVWTLDDTLEVLKRCQKYGNPTPVFQIVTCREDLLQLYENGAIRLGRHIMCPTGPSGLRERSKIVLPTNYMDLKVPTDLSELRPWVVVRDIEGEHFVTCTTVRDSRVIANVTCHLDPDGGLVPVENRLVDTWLSEFFGHLHLLRPVTGHISFRLVQPEGTSASMLPLGSRVGVSLPYICYNWRHPHLVWESDTESVDLNHSSSTNLSTKSLTTTDQDPQSVTKLLGQVLDKREALFAIGDPLPYCAYYHMLLPFRNMVGFMRRRQDSFPTPMMMAAPAR